MNEIVRTLPRNNAQLRHDIYRGTIFQLPANPASRRLIAAGKQLLGETLGEQARLAHLRFTPAQLFRHVGAMRRKVFFDTHFHQMLRDIILSLGFDPNQTAFDPARFRAVFHDGHHSPAARAAYLPHRDTWYANPQATVNCWLPLDDLTAAETFTFYPALFDKPVANDSSAFDYNQWVDPAWDRKIGWQNETTGSEAHYPASEMALPEGQDALRLPFACKRAEILLFSGAHLHGTLPQSTGRNRFSFDFRFAHLKDTSAGLGAPNVDNDSRGSCLRDYIHPNQPWPPQR